MTRPLHKSPRVVHVFIGLMISLLIWSCKRDDSDRTPPAIRFSFPAEYTILSDLATIRVIAGDNKGIKHVVYQANGDTAGLVVTPPYTFIWNTTAYPDCTGTDSYILLTAIAEDLAGNIGTAQRKFFVDNEGLPPIPVDWLPPSDVGKHSARLHWTPSIDYQFEQYIIWRDTTENVTATSDSVTAIPDPDATSYLDTGLGVTPWGLDENTDYYYRIWVEDSYGLSTPSDSVASITTLLPAPVSLHAPTATTKYTAYLTWQASQQDVAYYRLHRGQNEDLSDLDSVARVHPDSTAYLDMGLTIKSDYYYYLYLIDSAGYTHRFDTSDVILVTTDSLSQPVLVSPPLNISKYSIQVGWETLPEEEDSSWIALYRNTSSPVTAGSTLLFTGYRNSSLGHTDGGLTQGTDYVYRLRHWDSQNNESWSEELPVTTVDLNAIWQGGLGLRKQGKLKLELGWEIYQWSAEDDFVSYTLTRDGQELVTATNRATTQFEDPGLTRKTTYEYAITVTDTSGATLTYTKNFETRDILPATMVQLQVNNDWTYTMAWRPSGEDLDQFAKYRILRTTDPTITFADQTGSNIPDCLETGDCASVAEVTQQNPTSPDTVLTYTDADPNLIKIEQYNYTVLTYDVQGDWRPSNIKGLLLYAPPDAPSLERIAETDSSITIAWSRASWGSSNADSSLFDQYQVWRSTKNIEWALDHLEWESIYSSTDINTTEFTDRDATLGTLPRYYVVVLWDLYGKYAVSNRVFGVFQ